MKNYEYTKEVAISFREAVAKTKEELQKEGFGVLTEIDVKETMKKKLDIDYENYIILGACNPQLAHRAIEVEKEIGLFLPCNVIIYESDEKVYVSTILLSIMMKTAENDLLEEIADTAEDKLKNVINNLN
jgi:uncharacterized protein (DUF302 family)